MSEKTWTAYCVTNIDTKEHEYFILSRPIKLSARHSAFASALVRKGWREFYWEQSGTFAVRADARGARCQMAKNWSSSNWHPDPWEPEEYDLNFQHNNPHNIISCPYGVREEFVLAAIERRKINTSYQTKCILNRDPNKPRGLARKTTDEKTITIINRNNTLRDRRMRARASKLIEYNKSIIGKTVDDLTDEEFNEIYDIKDNINENDIS